MPESGSTSRDRQLRQIVAEFEHRRDGDFPIGPEELIADHPDFADELKAHFRLNTDGVTQRSDVLDESQHETTSVGSVSLSHDTGWVDETIAEDSQSSEMLARVAHDAPRTQFGRYRILRELGRGGMGAVYLAHDEQLDREVALKIPQFGTEMNADVLARFYREARSAPALRHPGICPVYDVGEIDGQHYITMAFIKGRPLREFTKSSKTQGISQLVRVVRKLAQALAEAHRHQVIHRDLKPANVMIDERKDPIVMDFGLARRSTENEKPLTHSGTVIGTPAYMSPEQVDGDNSLVGPPADIYSLGVIFYELLTGQMPFEGSLMSILRQIATVEPTPPTEVRDGTPPELEVICQKMMAKRIEDRYQSMDQVAADLTDFLRSYKSSTEEKRLLQTPGSSPDKKSLASSSTSTDKTVQPGRKRRKRTAKRTKKETKNPIERRGSEDEVVPPFGDEKARVEELSRRGEPSLVSKPLSNRAATWQKIQPVLSDWIRKSQEHWKLLAGVTATVVLGMMLWSLVSFLSDSSGTDRELAGEGTQNGNGRDESYFGPPERIVRVPRDTGEVSLFTGVDLTGWTAAGDATAWRAEEGVLVSDNGNPGVLWSSQPYSDFEFSFRFRIGTKSNSGIYLRSADRKMTRGGDQLEIQLLDDRQFPIQPENGRTGAIYGLKEPESRAYRAEQWNDMTIRLAGRLLEVTLNGHQIQNVSLDNVTQNFSKQPGLKRASGFIGIQTYGEGLNGQSRIEFDDLRIVDLTNLPDAVPAESGTGDWSIPFEFTNAQPVSEINRGDPINANASLSDDGLDIYWTREGSWRKPEIRTASRPRIDAPFGASTKVLDGRHGAVAADGRYVVYLSDGAGDQAGLAESFRDSKYQAFPPPTPVLKESRIPKSPSLSIDGLTLVFQRAGLNSGTTDLMISTRRRFDLPWTGPWTLRLESPAWMSDTLTWPFLGEDRLTLLFCNGGERNSKLIRATRPSEDSGFQSFEHITVDGLEITARAPHYVYKTGELFYSVPVDVPAGSWEVWHARAK